MTTTDFTFIDHGSVVLLMPRTPEATALVRSDAFAHAPVWGEAVVVEPRYVETLAAHLADDGFTCDLC